MVKIPSRVSLGEFIGLCKYDETDTARKIRGCSSVVITRVPEKDQADFDIVKQHVA